MKRIDFATDQRVRSLGERLPYTLYKYLRVDDEQRLEWLRRLLVDGELYFASSAELNDPFECAIAPSFAASEDQILEYARDWVERQGQDPAGREAEERWTPSFGQVFVTAKVESGFMIQATLG